MVEQSLTRVVQSILEGDPSILNALERGYANISAVARLIRPRVEEKLGRRVKLSGVITAIRRVRERHKSSTEHLRVIAESSVTIRTNLAKISLEKTRRNLERARLLSTEYPETFFEVIEGMETLTVIMDQRLLDDVKSKFRSEDIIDVKDNLSAIVIHSPREIIDTPGCVAEFYGVVARRGINMEETISCCTETIILLKTSDSGSAYSAIAGLIEEARRALQARPST